MNQTALHDDIVWCYYTIVLAQASLGSVLCFLDSCILSHLIWVQKKRGFDYLLLLSVLSLLQQLSCLPLSLFGNWPSTRPYLYDYQVYLSDWVSDALAATVGYVILALTLDRFIALYAPLRHREFNTARVKVALSITILLMGLITTSANADDLEPLRNSSRGFKENSEWTKTEIRNDIKMFGITIHYCVTIILIVLFATANWRKLRSMASFAGLRSTDRLEKHIGQKLLVSSKIMLALAFVYSICNAPYLFVDLLYNDENINNLAFLVFFVIANVLQTAGFPINLFLYSYFSRPYRLTLTRVTCRRPSINTSSFYRRPLDPPPSPPPLPAHQPAPTAASPPPPPPPPPPHRPPPHVYLTRAESTRF